jgi:hypothetical protein
MARFMRPNRAGMLACLLVQYAKLKCAFGFGFGFGFIYLLLVG